MSTSEPSQPSTHPAEPTHLVPAPTLPLALGDEPGQGWPAGRPFTRAGAAGHGVPVATLERMLRHGTLRRLLRGVYVDATVPDSTQLRAQALSLVVPRGAIVVDRTAAWLHGVSVLRARPDAVTPLEVLSRSAGPVGPASRSRTRLGSERALVGRDVETVHHLLVTTPLRTALDLGRLLLRERALAAMDALLATGRFGHTELLAELPRFAHQPGVVQLRELAPWVDARSQSPGESVLRLRWLEADLPTPAVRLGVPTPMGVRRLPLALPSRLFAAALTGELTPADLDAVAAQGWRVALLPPDRVIGSDAGFVTGHLRREFHQQLLAQLEAG